MLNRTETVQAPVADLWLAIERYAALQEEHLSALRRGRMQGVMEWRVERERAFNALRGGLDALGDLDALADRKLAERLGERIGVLLATENLLHKAVRDGRQSIREQQAALRKGRNAVRRLSSRPETGVSPRFVSSMA